MKTFEKAEVQIVTMSVNDVIKTSGSGTQGGIDQGADYDD